MMTAGMHRPAKPRRGARWLIARRCTQTGVLLLFLLGPWAGIWIVKGNLSASMTLDTVPLADPYVVLQTLAAGHLPARTVLLDALIVALFYLLVGGRVYCAWVCPVNVVTDAAHWLRVRWKLNGHTRISANTRYWVLGMTLLVSALSGVAAWELVNPVSLVHRGILFGFGAAWAVVLAVFLFDLAVSRRGWCGHLCPVGAFYSLLAIPSLIRVGALRRSRCDDCMDCYQVCPEPQVLKPVLHGAAPGDSPLITDRNCTNCGRCIDVCARQVFQFTTRMNVHENTEPLKVREAKP